jgi:hypothetical protein
MRQSLGTGASEGPNVSALHDKGDYTWIWRMVSLNIPTAKSIKMAVFWDAASCSLVDTDRSFIRIYCLYHRPDDGGSKHLWSVYQYLSDYTTQHLRRWVWSMWGARRRKSFSATMSTASLTWIALGLNSGLVAVITELFGFVPSYRPTPAGYVAMSSRPWNGSQII